MIEVLYTRYDEQDMLHFVLGTATLKKMARGKRWADEWYDYNPATHNEVEYDIKEVYVVDD